MNNPEIDVKISGIEIRAESTVENENGMSILVRRRVNQAEFAKRLGVTSAQINKACNAGWLVPEESRGSVMFLWPDAALPYVDNARDYVPSEKIALLVERLREERRVLMPVVQSDKTDSPTNETEPLMTYNEARQAREHWMAKREELDFRKAEGELVEVEFVKKRWEGIAITVQKAMMSIPDRTMAVLAGETDAHKIRQILVDEIKHACTSLRDGSRVTEGVIA